jgi:hypothetical protein
MHTAIVEQINLKLFGVVVETTALVVCVLMEKDMLKLRIMLMLQILKKRYQWNLIMVEQLESGLMKLRRRAKYELLDEQLQELASSFDIITRDLYFKRARALFHF